MINQFIIHDEHQEQNYLTLFIIGFKKKIIIIIKKSSFSMHQPLLSSNTDISICFLSDIEDIYDIFKDKTRIITKK